MSNTIIYGIPNCGSVKKAIEWFTHRAVPFQFHNYKKEGIDKTKIKSWCKQVGWEFIFNKKGTTWRGMAEKYKNIPLTEKLAITIMLENNSIIKRPVVEYKNKLLVGFDETIYLKEIKF